MSKYLITVNRKRGSGGSDIAKLLADRLGIKYYDKELISLAAKESGYAESLFESADEKPSNSLLYSIAMGTYSPQTWFLNTEEPFTNDRLFSIQAEVIRKIAAEPCIIVGRCADFILRDDPDVTSVYTYASFEYRKRSVLGANKALSEKEAESYLKKMDKSRSNYYNYYTNRVWDNPCNYHAAINTEFYSREDAATLIETAVRLKKKA
ncbi:MAG: cytidylate kinase-like family protein [Oscillospiraceae bacterium]|jgi:cytidylate kinase|nr:cytidylate kinase-like family protein [Oscillospiraceae bacterium]